MGENGNGENSDGGDSVTEGIVTEGIVTGVIGTEGIGTEGIVTDCAGERWGNGPGRVIKAGAIDSKRVIERWIEGDR